MKRVICATAVLYMQFTFFL